MKAQPKSSYPSKIGILERRYPAFSLLALIVPAHSLPAAAHLASAGGVWQAWLFEVDKQAIISSELAHILELVFLILLMIGILLVAWTMLLRGQVASRTSELELEIAERKRAEESLRASEERFHSIFENSPAAIWEEDFSEVKAHIDRLDQQGVTDFRTHWQDHPEEVAALAGLVKVVEMNKTSVRMLGEESKDQVRPLQDYFTAETLRVFLGEFVALAEGKTHFESEITLTGKQGEPVIYHLVLIVQPGSEQSLKRVLVTFVDITATKKAEEALRESEERYRLLINTSPDAIYLHREGNFIFANPAGFSLLGAQTPEDLIGTPIRHRVHAAFQELVNQRMETMRQLGQPVPTIEEKFIRLDGRLVDVEVSAGSLVFQGKFTVMVIARDITERKRAEETLRSSEASLKISQQVAHVGSWAWDIPANKITWSDEMYSIFGLPFATFDGRVDTVMQSLIHPGDYASVAQFQQDLLLASKPEGRECRIVWPDQSVHTVWVEAGERTMGASGNVEKVFGIVQDITERKQVEAALRLSEEKFRKAFLTSPDSININRLSDGMYVAINQGFTDTMGYTESDVIGKTSIEIKIWENTADRQKLVEGLLKHGEVENLEARFVRKDGGVTYGLMSASIIELGGIKHILSITRDITERKQAQEKIERTLAEKEALLRELYHRTKNNMQVIIALLDLQAEQIGDPRLNSAFTDTQNRIRSMALVHQKLYEASDLSHINLKEYISDLVALLMSSYQVWPGQVTLQSEMENVYVLIDSAVPCGLILNELVSNTLKYAFPGERQGVIRLGICRDDQNDIVLEYADNGVGLPPGFDLSRDGGLGIKTIRVLAENQLRGQVHFSGSPGVRCRIQFADQYYKPRV